VNPVSVARYYANSVFTSCDKVQCAPCSNLRVRVSVALLLLRGGVDRVQGADISYTLGGTVEKSLVTSRDGQGAHDPNLARKSGNIPE